MSYALGHSLLYTLYSYKLKSAGRPDRPGHASDTCVEQKGCTFIFSLALRYARYAIVTLTSIGFSLTLN